MSRIPRRGLILGGAAVLTGCARPRLTHSGSTTSPSGIAAPPDHVLVQSGDVTASSVVLWAKSSARGGKLVVDVTTRDDPGFARARRVAGPLASADSDYTAQVVVPNLPSGTALLFRAGFGDPSPPAMSPGETRTAPADDRDVTFAWSGDTVGQGWGIDLARGGLGAYGAMRGLAPDFFVHVGDMIYADSPLVAEVPLADGSIWRNVMTSAKAKVAETLDDFRGNFAYPFHCPEFRAFARDVPIYAVWDDHEVYNDWWPGETRADPRYAARAADALSRRAWQAMHEYVPFRPSSKLYRSISWGAGLELFVTDGRSYRTPNSENREPEGAAFWGPEQLAWLIRGLTASRSTWKVVACDMPLGLVLPHYPPPTNGPVTHDGFGQGEGPPLGREREISALLSACRAAGVKNLLFLTADVHYAAHHRYDPARATWKDFHPFHECVAGPLHASSFPPKSTDPTFGPEVLFQVAEPVASGSGPEAGRQSFGLVRVAKGSHDLHVALHSGTGARLYDATLAPSGPR